MKIIHIHGYKCAGTTLENILERNFSDLLLIESKHGGARLFFDQIPKKMLQDYSAISSHLLAPSDTNIFQFSLIRHPYDRLVSAWIYQRITKEVDSSFREYIKNYNSSKISNYQAKLLSKQNQTNSPQSGWEINLDFDFLFGDSFFLGVVDKFDESMVLLEEKMKKRGFELDLSYPSKANITSKVKKQNIPDLSNFAYPSIDTDLWLYKKANHMLDIEIENTQDFDKKLSCFKERCKKSSFSDKKQSKQFI